MEYEYDVFRKNLIILNASLRKKETLKIGYLNSISKD